MSAGLLIGLLAVASLGACGSSAASGASTPLSVVAAENFWGSIVAQLGGTRVSVTGIVSDPNADPHEYSASAVNARAFADASYVIVNGAGYDGWAQKLITANPAGGRVVLDCAALVGVKTGDNPHLWYNPAFVTAVADRITKDLTALSPGDAAYFAAQRIAFGTALAPERQLISAIGTAYSHTAIGATETIVAYQAAALNLDLISPAAFMQAVAESTDPPVQSVVEMQNQLRARRVAVLVVNTQTVTPLTSGMKSLAAQNGIPTVGITETMTPSYATFQAWQVAQLTALQSALRTARPNG